MPSKKLNLIFLPFAGASFYSYRNFERYLPESIRPVNIDLPGRGKRMKEPILTDIHDMVRDIFSQIRTDLQNPYAFYGHSMGATLAYHLTLFITGKNNISQPLHLFASGSLGPAHDIDQDLSSLPRDEFIEAVLTYGGIPEEILQHDELLDFFIPVLKADFRAIYALKDNPDEIIDVPITAMLGDKDRLTMDRRIRWGKLTNGECESMHFHGDHFFIFTHLQEICRIISDKLKVC